MNFVATKALSTAVITSLVLLLGACSISVDDKDKKDGNVDIKTPFANLKVDSSEKAADNGIPVYPGAHLRPPDKDGDNHSANINMGAMGFGLKVIAAEYETSDSPDKVKTFYEDKMKRFGGVLTCNGHSGGSDIHFSKNKKDDGKLSCSDTSGNGWEIKAGTDDDEHLVSIEPNGSGTRFGTVLVQTKGKDTL
ncbi:MAG: hypothetical protein WCC25_07070 [Candidatus Korobacteraceae bacterium]